MYKLFEEKKRQLTKATQKKYKQFDKELIKHAEQKQNNRFLTEKEKNILQVFHDFGINITINNKINSFQNILFEITPDSKEDLKKMLKNKKMLTYYLKTEIKQNDDVFIIEYQKEKKDVLYLYNILENNNKNNINVNIGKDTKNDIVNMNVEKLPHLLIGGTTGSGKSVFINTLITSLIYNYTPEEIQLFLVDPKRTELKAFSDIPQ